MKPDSFCRNYDVYFEVFGKKLKATVLAESENAAKDIVKAKIIFHKISLKPKDAFNEAVNVLDDIMSILK